MTEAHGGHDTGEDIRPHVRPPIHRPRWYDPRQVQFDPRLLVDDDQEDLLRPPTPPAELFDYDDVDVLQQYDILLAIRQRTQVDNVRLRVL